MISFYSGGLKYSFPNSNSLLSTPFLKTNIYLHRGALEKDLILIRSGNCMIRSFDALIFYAEVQLTHYGLGHIGRWFRFSSHHMLVGWAVPLTDQNQLRHKHILCQKSFDGGNGSEFLFNFQEIKEFEF